MNQRTWAKWTVGAASIASALCFAAACKTEQQGVSEGQGDGGATQAQSGPCGEYATRMCKETGPDSPTCQSIKTATELMPAAACEAALKDVAYSIKQLAGKRKKCDELVSKLCKDLGKETESCKMVTEQTKMFPPERCDMMMQHYAEVLGSLKAREAANKPLNAELQAAIAANDAPSFGPENAKVTVVEFSDFECPFCSRAASVVTQLREKYGTKVRFVFRQFPLPMHPNAQKASEAALAANAQGKFWQFHDELFEHQRELDRASLEKYAKEHGLNVNAFKKALDDNTFQKAVEKDKSLGERVFVQGTPTMFINGTRVSNPTDFAVVSKMIEDALKG